MLLCGDGSYARRHDGTIYPVSGLGKWGRVLWCALHHVGCDGWAWKVSRLVRARRSGPKLQKVCGLNN